MGPNKCCAGTARWAATWLAVILLIGVSSHAMAQKRVALVIGNGAYKETVPLKNTTNDAADMSGAAKRLGFAVLDGFDLDKRGMERLIRQFDLALAGADLGLFFYAGHALQVSGQNYLLPVDARLAAEGDIDFESLPLNLILRRMERETRTALILIDACRDNPLARNLARSMGTRSAQIGSGLSEVRSGVGTLIAFSTQPGNVALDGTGRNSPYTTALLKEIEVPGRDVLSTLAVVRGAVLRATGGKQVPWEHTSLVGPVVLMPHAAASPVQTLVSAPPDIDTAAREWQDIKHSSSLVVIERYLQRHKAHSVYAALAQERLDTLRDNAPAPTKAAVAPPSKALATALPLSTVALNSVTRIEINNGFPDAAAIKASLKASGLRFNPSTDTFGPTAEPKWAVSIGADVDVSAAQRALEAVTRHYKGKLYLELMTTDEGLGFRRRIVIGSIDQKTLPPRPTDNIGALLEPGLDTAKLHRLIRANAASAK